MIVLLISVNLIHRDRVSGSIKTTLQMPRTRRKYLLKKIGVSFTAGTLIILLPLLLAFILLGISQGFAGIDTPVLLTKNYLNLILPSDEIYELRDFPTISAIGLSRYTVSWLSGRNLLESMEFIPLWQFLILAVILLALYILFCTVVAQFISVVIKNEILAQIVALGIFILGNSFGRIFPKLKTSPLDLFAMADVIPILEGSHCSTYLASILALALATVLLFVLSDRIFQRQDIS
ncbi:MAG: ABC transporter permease subunit [Firmicutes bacterium]|nr:ABC transporter permease subunit [Bacillota bacterium]